MASTTARFCSSFAPRMKKRSLCSLAAWAASWKKSVVQMRSGSGCAVLRLAKTTGMPSAWMISAAAMASANAGSCPARAMPWPLEENTAFGIQFSLSSRAAMQSRTMHCASLRRETEAVGKPPTCTTGKSWLPLSVAISTAMVAPVPGDELFQSVRQAGLGGVAIVAAYVADVRVSGVDIARLHWQHPLLGLLPEQPLEQLDHVQQLLGMVVAKVVDLVRHIHSARHGALGNNRFDRIDDVVDVRKSPSPAAAGVHVDRLARHDGIGELVVRHVRSAQRTVDGEETQAGDRKPVQMRIGMRHQLVRLLGGGIQRYRGVDAVFRGERQLGVGPVHRR